MSVLSDQLNQYGFINEFMLHNLINAQELEKRPILRNFIFENLDVIFRVSDKLPSRYLFELSGDEEQTINLFELYIKKITDITSINTNISSVVLDLLKQKSRIHDKFGASLCEITIDIIRNVGLSSLKSRLHDLPREALEILAKHPGVVDNRAMDDYPVLKKIMI